MNIPTHLDWRQLYRAAEAAHAQAMRWSEDLNGAGLACVRFRDAAWLKARGDELYREYCDGIFEGRATA